MQNRKDMLTWVRVHQRSELFGHHWEKFTTKNGGASIRVRTGLGQPLSVAWFGA